MKKNIVIVVLSMIILGLGSYLVYDKLLNKEEVGEKNPSQEDKINDKTDEKNKGQEDKIEEKDIAYFEEYLYYFMPEPSMGYFLKKIDSFNEEDIKEYIYTYYIYKVNRENLSADIKDGEYDGTYTYTVSREEVAKLVNKYFGIEDFKLTKSDSERWGIRKLNDDIYQVYWYAVGYYVPECKLTSVVYDGKNVKVTGKITDSGLTDFKKDSEFVFHLVYNNGNYNVKSIEYDED